MANGLLFAEQRLDIILPLELATSLSSLLVFLIILWQVGGGEDGANSNDIKDTLTPYTVYCILTRNTVNGFFAYCSLLHTTTVPQLKKGQLKILTVLSLNLFCFLCYSSFCLFPALNAPGTLYFFSHIQIHVHFPKKSVCVHSLEFSGRFRILNRPLICS